MRVKMELLPGAKVADVPSFIHEGERVGFGQFEVVSNKVTYSGTGVPTARMQIRQTSMREDVVVNPKPATAALKSRFPSTPSSPSRASHRRDGSRKVDHHSATRADPRLRQQPRRQRPDARPAP